MPAVEIDMRLKAYFAEHQLMTRADFQRKMCIRDRGNPDVLLVFGGTNDSWAKAPVGSYQYADWTKADLYSFRPAFCRLMDLSLIHISPRTTVPARKLCRRVLSLRWKKLSTVWKT